MRTLPPNHPDTYWIGTITEAMIDSLQPHIHDPTHIRWEDIVAGLGNTCRYGGQCYGYYSVAEHSIMVSQLMTEIVNRQSVLNAGYGMLHPVDAAHYGLIHDGPEAYMGDMPRPIKGRMGMFKLIENQWWELFKQRFEIEESPDMIRLKEECDRIALIAEMRVLKPDCTKVYEYRGMFRVEDFDDTDICKIRKLDPEPAKEMLDEYAKDVLFAREDWPNE